MSDDVLAECQRAFAEATRCEAIRRDGIEAQLRAEVERLRGEVAARIEAHMESEQIGRAHV